MPASDLADLTAAYSDAFPFDAPVRLLVFADQLGASQSIAFIDGLSNARAGGRAAVRILEEAAFGPDEGLAGAAAARELAEAEMAGVQPTAVVLSRFGHVAATQAVFAAARARGLPVVLHIDDDLFGLPVVVGIERYRSGRHPRRIQALAAALRRADLVIAATEALALQLAPKAGHGRIGWLENGTGGRPWPRESRPEGSEVVIGYMGSASHGPDLELVLPALERLLTRRRDVRVELFGSISRLPAADRLPGAVIRHEAMAGDYAAFKARLRALEWDIGLAPLQASPYNLCKTATKWAEYAEAGAAVLASDVEVYRPMIAWGAAAPATPGQWELALDRLVDNAALRRALVASADQLLEARFGWTRLEESLLGLVARARAPRKAA
jgi:glycosyltransferase involved in cell wall biosynthesis